MRALRLSILADQLGSPAGGGRFIRGFLRALLADRGLLDEFEWVRIVATQNEPLERIGPLPSRVSTLRRRFPERLRLTPLARLFRFALPAGDVSFGPFYYTFPSRARARIVTVHDLSCFHEPFHPPERIGKLAATVTRMIHECDGVVCISESTRREFQERWPHLAHKTAMIYNGVSADEIVSADTRSARDRSIVVVGTIEPRKNYATLLDAFEQLVAEQGETAPKLIVVGGVGWMSLSVERRLTALEASGRCRWLRNASDRDLAEAYATAGVFTYLSLYEGFGYPPFEAAFARCPMVLSSASSVGEIWSGHARCVDPLNTADIVAAWKWALSLDAAERENVVQRQENRAREFTWHRAAKEYVAFWRSVIETGGDHEPA